MVDFEQLRAERQSLSDKIEGAILFHFLLMFYVYIMSLQTKYTPERNNELAKLRLRCNADTQILAHVREKEFMLNNILDTKTGDLVRSTNEMSSARNEVNRQKSERDELRKTFNNLSQSCGLLDKPDLLSDYDKVQAAIVERQQDIETLRATIAETKAKTKVALADLHKMGSKSRSREGAEVTVSVDDVKLPWIRNGVPIKRLQNHKPKKYTN